HGGLPDRLRSGRLAEKGLLELRARIGIGAREVGLLEFGRLAFRAGEGGLLEERAGELCALQPGPREIRSRKLGLLEDCAFEVCPVEIGLRALRAGKYRLGSVALRQHGLDEARPLES